MAHFAKVVGGTVQEVIVADQEFINSGLAGEPTQWVQTSYNTRGGKHYEPNSNTESADQSKALRKNYASVGDIYDSTRDAFYKPQPYSSWVLNETSCIWEAPVAYPTTLTYTDSNNNTVNYTIEWDETNTRWINELDQYWNTSTSAWTNI